VISLRVSMITLIVSIEVCYDCLSSLFLLQSRWSTYVRVTRQPCCPTCSHSSSWRGSRSTSTVHRGCR